MESFLETLSCEKMEALQKFGKLSKLQKPEPEVAENIESESEYAPSIVHECCVPHTQQTTGKLNVSYRRWRRSFAKRWLGATGVEATYWFPISMALVLRANDICIELTHKHKKLMWPTPGNRNLSKRDFEAHQGGARVCLRGASVYFRFWMSWVTGLVKGDRVRGDETTD